MLTLHHCCMRTCSSRRTCGTGVGIQKRCFDGIHDELVQMSHVMYTCNRIRWLRLGILFNTTLLKETVFKWKTQRLAPLNRGDEHAQQYLCAYLLFQPAPVAFMIPLDMRRATLTTLSFEQTICAHTSVHYTNTMFAE